MGRYSQAGRAISVATPLGQDALLLERFTGAEEISRLFHFRLDLLAEAATTVSFERILGQGVSIAVAMPNGQRHFHGIVRRLTQGKTIPDSLGGQLVRYEADVVPALWFLTKNVQSRVFQHLSVPAILRQVLRDLDVVYEIQGEFAPRDYCVQYRESDFAFASRLMEEEGIYYFFKHSEHGHQLVLANTPQSHADVPGAAHVFYDDVEGGLRDEDRVFDFAKSQEVTAGKVTLRDYSFELPGQSLEATQLIQESVTVGTVPHALRAANNGRLEIYDYPGRYAQRFDGIDSGGDAQPAALEKVFSDNQRTALIRMQQEATTAVAVRGASYCRQFTSGHKFTLVRHATGKGLYVLTRVEHSASIAGTYTNGRAEAAELVYENRFQALPAELPFRPAPLTPRPTIAGTQTATVVGPAGEDTFVDQYGRVKVQFRWDRQGKSNAESSCWVRVGQVWAGKRWGAFFWPRIGHEVIVAFEEGDPDQPIVVGSVYNAANAPPFTLPDNVLVNGIRSCSAGGQPDTNSNAILFHDDLGDEHLVVHSERQEIANSEQSKSVKVGQKHVQIVGGPSFASSGSGSGAGSGAVSDTWGDIEHGLDVAGEWSAKNLNMTFGNYLVGTLGMEGTFTIGSWQNVAFNPLGFLGQASNPILAGIGSIGGVVNWTIGAMTTLTYGTNIAVLRGANIQNQADLSGLGMVGATLLGAMMTAEQIATAYIGDYGDDLVVLTEMIAIGVETKLALAAAAAHKAAESAALTSMAVQVPADTMTGILDGSVGAAEAALAIATAAATNLVNPVSAQATLAANNVRSFDSNYTVNAWNISLNSGYTAVQGAVAPVNAPLVGTTINISATGVANAGGTVVINGTQQASMTSGGASVALASSGGQGNVVINCGAIGSLALQRTNLNPLQFIKLSTTGIALTQMAGTINLTAGDPAAAASSVALDSVAGTLALAALNSITLGVGANTITINQAGIVLAAGNNSITINAQGITFAGLNVALQSELDFVVEALNLTMSVTAELLQDVDGLLLQT